MLRNYAPTLYKVLTDADSAVKAVPDFKVGEDTLNVFAIRSSVQEKGKAKDKLIQTCVRICKEINTTNHARKSIPPTILPYGAGICGRCGCTIEVDKVSVDKATRF